MRGDAAIFVWRGKMRRSAILALCRKYGSSRRVGIMLGLSASRVADLRRDGEDRERVLLAVASKNIYQFLARMRAEDATTKRL